MGHPAIAAGEIAVITGAALGWLLGGRVHAFRRPSQHRAALASPREVLDQRLTGLIRAHQQGVVAENIDQSGNPVCSRMYVRHGLWRELYKVTIL